MSNLPGNSFDGREPNTDFELDALFMARAIELAARGEGHVEPNPMVGCVIVRDGAVVGEGWHQKFGGPHAEVEALSRGRSECSRCYRLCHARALLSSRQDAAVQRGPNLRRDRPGDLRTKGPV